MSSIVHYRLVVDQLLQSSYTSSPHRALIQGLPVALPLSGVMVLRYEPLLTFAIRRWRSVAFRLLRGPVDHRQDDSEAIRDGCRDRMEVIVA